MSREARILATYTAVMLLTGVMIGITFGMIGDAIGLTHAATTVLLLGVGGLNGYFWASMAVRKLRQL